MHCLSPEQQAAWVQGTLGDSEREAIEDHLSRCPTCRRALIQARESTEPIAEVEVPAALLQTARALGRRPAPRRPRRWWLPVTAAAAAVLAWVAVDVGQLGPPSPDESVSPAPGSAGVLRAAPTRGPELRPLEPEDGAVVPRGVVVVRWHKPERARRVTVTATDGLGNILLEETTEASELALDLAAFDPRPESGSKVYWVLASTLPDGTQLTTEPRGLVVADGAEVNR